MAARASPPFWLAFLPLAIAAAYLQVRWDAIPDRWVSHWGPGGVPDGWSTKSAGAVFGPLLFALPMIGVFELVALVVRTKDNDRPGREALAEAVVALMRWALLVVVSVIAWVAALLPFGGVRVEVVLFVALAGLVAALALGGRRVALETRAVAAREGLEGYGGGVFYRNPKDPRLWVPKISGIGSTLNFAHPWAWPIFLVLLGVPIAIIVLAFTAAG